MSSPIDPDLASLVGLRTVKGGHYAQYRGSEASLNRVMMALEGISKALVQTAAGPETLLVAVVETVRTHLDAAWVLFALADGQLSGTAPRHLIANGDGEILAFEGVTIATPPTGLPDPVLNRLNDVLRGEVTVLHGPIVDDHHVHVPIELDGAVVGGLSAWTSDARRSDPSDLTVLRILAGQATVALVNSSLFLQAQQRAEELAERNDELVQTQRELSAVQRYALLSAERARIARELHDSVGQTVLSAGLQMELCRDEVSPAGADHLEKAVRLSRDAMEHLRGAIFTLTQPSEPSSSIADTLDELCSLHMPPGVETSVTVRGRVRELPGDVQHSVLRIVGESLVNAALHADPSRVAVTLDYNSAGVRVRVDDDGAGDPADLRAVLRSAERGDIAQGRSRGLVNMASRAAEHHGSFSIRRSRLGGVRIAAMVPTPAEERQ
ncbi:sensor histidine kinase [Gordonia sp. PDNC005]|uniref:MadS family sensor histidine kinase n=1 Tax=unclassified Gordonia (in: high G+C Gram-positive bacteria) TaxID=2657482 RepID=UPI001964068F|nr:GAF domain-containing sensor histidine kinase [Gordonia sp. PDNC005]QRY63617.1 sensor histidine kinase [Gordonia sp. PDNC005]